MIIELGKISDGGTLYSGELPEDVLVLEGDRFIRPNGPVCYALTAEIVSGQLLIHGSVETTLDLCCVACADFFSTKVRVSSFLRAYSIEPGMDELDLTGDIREDILLEVPHYPRGDVDETGRCRACGRNMQELSISTSQSDMTPPSRLWDSLDGLNLSDDGKRDTSNE